MRRNLKGISIKNILLLMFFIINIYFSYRYIFQYNSEGTSPTYSDTPFAFQVGKYVILAAGIALCVILAIVFNKGIKFHFFEAVLTAFIILLVLFGILNSQTETTIKIVIVIVMAGFILLLNDINGFIKSFITVNKVILAYHIIYSAIQLFMFYRYGRLSALSYANAQRYGGGYDDPNSFALYMILPVCYILLKGIRGRFTIKSLLLLFVCVVLEFLTYSLTGYAILIAALLIIVYFERKLIFRYNRKVKVVAFIVFMAAMGVLLFFANYSKIVEFINQKLGSISIHVGEYLLNINLSSVKTFLFGSSGGFSENFWNLILNGYGIFALILFGIVATYITYASYRVYRHYRDDVSLICFIFVLCTEVFSINLPYFSMIPANVFYWYLAFIAIYRYNKYRAERIYRNRIKSAQS